MEEIRYPLSWVLVGIALVILLFIITLVQKHDRSFFYEQKEPLPITVGPIGPLDLQSGP